MRREPLHQGFTLIELLVVITIIAILASIAVPVYNSVTERAKITRVISNAKQINLASRTFAIDNSGVFPTGFTAETGAGDQAEGGQDTTSTACFNELIPDYIPQESIFYTAGQLPANNKRIPDENNELMAAENCFSYVVGLTDSSPGNIPFLADFFTGQGEATYDRKHIWWKTKKAVVGRCDGSAAAEKVNEQGWVLGSDRQSNLFTAPEQATGGGDSGAGGLVDPELYRVVNP